MTAWRWTDGDAMLPIDGPAALLVVELGGTMTYLIPVEAPEPAPNVQHATA